MARTVPTARHHARRPRGRAQRGAALLMAVVSVAMLTALAVDLTYETQVRLRIAGNARDELRAQALAQSAVTMSRLVLSMQQQVNLMCGAVSLAQGGAAGGAAAPSLPCPQIWNMVPVGSSITQALFTEASGAKAAASAKAGDKAKPSAAGAGGAPALPAGSVADFQGGYEARIEDEGQKINVQLDGTAAGGMLSTQVEALLRLTCDAKWDPLFDRTDADGQRYSRSDLVVNLKDWVDQDLTGSSLSASFPGGNCSPVVAAGRPFEDGFSDENLPYDRGTDRYRAKNARFDSLEELHLVAGVSDAFMAAFGDQLTVYATKEPKMGVNGPPEWQLRLAEIVTDDATRPKLSDPAFRTILLKALNVATMGGSFNIATDTWVQTLKSVGVPVRSQYSQSSTSPLTDKSIVFRIRAKGVAGDVTHEIDAVVTYNQADLPPEEQVNTRTMGASNKPPLGALIHWRED